MGNSSTRDEETASQVEGVKPSQAVQDPGSLCNIKNLWDGGIDKHGYKIWLDEIPDDGQDLDACEETLRYAITLRHQKTNTRNTQALRDVIIRSKYMRKLLEACVPAMSEYYDGAQKGIILSHPFKPLFFGWSAIEKGLAVENQGSIFNMHASLLHTTLKKVYDQHFSAFLEMTGQCQITFNLLWALLPIGTDARISNKGREMITRISSVEYRSSGEDAWWAIECRYISWNGKSFGWDTLSQTISAFQGRKTIRDLLIYPLQFDEDVALTKSTLARRGRAFAQIATKEPLIKQYSGEYNLNNDQSSAWWAPRRKVKVAERIMLDTLAYNQYGGSSVGGSMDLFDPKIMISALDEPDRSAKDSDTFIYCSPFLYAFGLKSKQWLEFDIHAFSDVVWNTDAWSQLVLDDETKTVTRAFAHTQLNGGGDGFDDFIAGKSQGMIMLLAGPPGTGKTFTAESLGDELRQPLYSVSASELGSSASEVESSLGRAFDLSARWNALVLLDEADVFLQRRSESHLERNGVVAVFLRKLEYFKGLVFLTTNRPSDFDEAFESRIHITIQYPALTRDGRKQVWGKMIAKADDTAEHGAELGQENISKLSDVLLNGREIRNIIKSAMLLSKEEGCMLTKKHIDIILKVKYGTRKPLT